MNEKTLPNETAHTSSTRENPWLHRYAVVLASLTLFLIVAGGMVTSTGSGLSVPDWPTTYGHNMFLYPPSQWVGGIFYEHGHRLIASTVGFLTIGLAVWLQWRDPRRWLRRLGWLALLAVIAQGVLGGLTVLYRLPTWVSVSHACLAQSFFCLVVAIAVFTGPAWRRRSLQRVVAGSGLRVLCGVLVVFVFAQLLLGALMRHTDSGLAVVDFPLAYGQIVPDLSPTAVETYNQQRMFEHYLPGVSARQILFHMLHRLGALVVTITLLSTTVLVFRRHGRLAELRRPAIGATICLVLQIGLGAWTVWSGKSPWVATAHVAVGAATLGACWILSLRILGYPRSSERASKIPVFIPSGATA